MGSVGGGVAYRRGKLRIGDARCPGRHDLFDFDLTPRRVDLVSEPFDVAIRMVPTMSTTVVLIRSALDPIRLDGLPRGWWPSPERGGLPGSPSSAAKV